MVDVRVRQRQRFRHIIEIREHLAKYPQHLVAVAGEAAVYEQQLPSAFQYICVASAGRLDQTDRDLVGDAPVGDYGIEVRALISLDKLGKAVNEVEGFEGLFVPLVQYLHDAVGIDQKFVGALLAEREQLPHLAAEVDIENRIVQHLFSRVIFEYLHLTQRRQLVEQALHNARLLDMQPHLEVLVAAAVLLRTHIIYVDLMASKHLEHRCHRARHVPQTQRKKNHLFLALAMRKISYLFKLPIYQLQRRLICGNVYKKRVDVHTAVVIDSDDIPTMPRYYSARLQKRTGLVRHFGDK